MLSKHESSTVTETKPDSDVETDTPLDPRPVYAQTGISQNKPLFTCFPL